MLVRVEGKIVITNICPCCDQILPGSAGKTVEEVDVIAVVYADDVERISPYDRGIFKAFGDPEYKWEWEDGPRFRLIAPGENRLQFRNKNPFESK